MTINPILKRNILWWERKRIFFNLLVLGVLIYQLVTLWHYPMRAIIGSYRVLFNAFIYFLTVNLLYSLGTGLEFIMHYFFASSGLNSRTRWALFLLGTLLSLFLTATYVVLEFDVLFSD
ncbi:MAG: hypothetical protein N4A41_03240 [Crocinitomicaceae bacterium]|nr:hypothetical protein [Crocinitomicaceae bacterium]